MRPSMSEPQLGTKPKKYLPSEHLKQTSLPSIIVDPTLFLVDGKSIFPNLLHMD